MKNLNKRLLITMLMAFAVLACTGCSNSREEKQAQYREEGIAYLENGEYEKAVDSFQSALYQALGEVGEEEIDICFYKAEALYLSGDVQGALDTYTAIIELNENAKAYYLRGNLYYSLGEEEKALSDYETAVEKEKDNYELYIGIYEALLAHDKEQEALEYLNDALKIGGSSGYDKMQKGRINYLLGETETAISLLEKAIEKKEVAAYYYLAEINVAMGDEEAAKENLENYISSGEADSYKLCQAGNTQIEEGNYEMAIKCLEAAMELEKVPNKQMVMKSLVIAYEYSEDFEAAKTLMEEYVNTYPEDEQAAREYTFLKTR